MRIAINGAGVAGPTLAYWLRNQGHDVLLVEEAPALRSGGYVIDFWGLGYDVADRMDLRQAISERGYHVREVRFVDAHGLRVGGFSTDVFERVTQGRFTSLRRSDLSALIYGALEDSVETIFGDSIAGIEEHRDAVRVRFDRAAARDVDLLAGEGTGLAMTEAYVLASALAACPGDVAAALARYQTVLMPFLRRKQASAARFASSFVPRTRFGLVFRNVVTGLLRISAVADVFIGRELRDDFVLPAAREPAAPSARGPSAAHHQSGPPRFPDSAS